MDLDHSDVIFLRKPEANLYEFQISRRLVSVRKFIDNQNSFRKIFDCYGIYLFDIQGNNYRFEIRSFDEIVLWKNDQKQWHDNIVGDRENYTCREYTFYQVENNFGFLLDKSDLICKLNNSKLFVLSNGPKIRLKNFFQYFFAECYGQIFGDFNLERDFPLLLHAACCAKYGCSLQQSS
jgi:hypothetical protein